MNENMETCLNIWFVVDHDSKLIYRAAARAYALSGSDEVKTAILKCLALTDFHLATHFSLSKYKTTLVDPSGRERELHGVFNNASFEAILPEIFDTISKGLEKQFPEQPRITSNGSSKYKMKIADGPYYVMTFLFEDNEGNLVPQ